MKKKTRKKKSRAYDSSSRQSKTGEVRAQIIKTYVELLAENRGEETLIDDIAKRSKISERTIYRLFNDTQSLGAATDEYVMSYLLESGKQLGEKTVPEFAQFVFEQFDRYENLVLAYLYSRFGIAARTGFRQKFNRLLIAKILHEKKLTLNKALEIKLAVIVSLINAKIWDDIRTDFKLSGGDIGAGIRDAITVLIAAL